MTHSFGPIFAVYNHRPLRNSNDVRLLLYSHTSLVRDHQANDPLLYVSDDDVLYVKMIPGVGQLLLDR